MADFTISYNRTAANEGGYQALPNDPGNYNSLGQLVGTNWGISAKVYEDWIKHPPTAQEMVNMPKSTAKAIFRAKYWEKIWGDQLPNQFVADLLFDTVVNHGQGVKLAQQAAGVTADNIFGSQTFNAISKANPATFYNALKERRRQYYYQLVEDSPGLFSFLSGWLKRLDKYNDFSTGATMAGGGVLALLLLLYIGYSNPQIFRA